MISRVAVGMGIPTGLPYGWEFILAYGNCHIWEFYGKSSFPLVRILCEIVNPICGNPLGIATEILWEWDGNGNENSLPTATLSKFQYLCVICTQIITIFNNDITITNKICMGFVRRHT